MTTEMQTNGPPKASPTIGALAAALAKAQSEMEAAPKDARNPHLNSRYADLPSIWSACRKVLTKNGLAVIQRPGIVTTESGDALVVVATLLVHTSGEWVESHTVLKPVPDKAGNVTPQITGSAITYGRRYGLAAMVGVVADEDDDAASASRSHQATARGNGTEPPPIHDAPPIEDEPAAGDDPVLSDKQRKTIWAIAKALSAPTASEPFKAWLTEQVGFHIDSLSTMKATTADLVIEALRAQERALPKGQQDLAGTVTRGRP